ncbi:hypothetical protein Goshw_009364 [Gossypium schwendimanii]|uniref:Uncharacterized protein n=1 Tax=Gossypium schwendimanii TaxID=34291 RepID=A0A7J9LMW1_GOSSC|nr:hypothetical protein [Gossypium schwendimanii]
MHMDRCKSLKDLAPYLFDLNVHDCTSFESFFADQNLYQFDLLSGEDDGVFCMLFSADGGYEKFESTISFLDASESERYMGDHENDADATEMRPTETKRSLSHDGEERDGGPKRFQ